MIKRTIIILFMLIASPVFAQNKGTPAPPAATAEEIATLKADAHAAEKRLQELEIRDAIREAKSELDGRANTRLDIWIGVYGILFAIFAIGFGYISHRLAIAEVKKELASSRDEINELARSVQSAARSATKAQEEADTALTTAQEAAEEAQNALLVAKGAAKDAEKHRANAQESAQAARKGAEAARVLAERASTGKTVEATDKEKETLNKAVETAGPDESGWSIDQFKSAIGKALYVDENYEDAIRLTKSMAAKHGKNNEAYAYALNRLGDAQQELMLWHDAGSSYNDVITRCKGKAQNATRRHLCWAYHHYGICLSHLGQPAVAAKQFKLAVDLSKKLRGPEARSTLSARHELARAILDQGRTAEAETILKELIPIRERIEGPEALNTIITRHALACTTLYLGRAAEAEAMFRELLPLFEQAKGIDTISAYVPRYWLALAILERGDLNQAQALLDTIPDLSSKKSWLPRYAAKLAYVRGKTADALGKNDEALICLNEAQQIYAEIYPPDHFERKTVDTYLANRGAPS